jgi:hypothetical protein
MLFFLANLAKSWRLSGKKELTAEAQREERKGRNGFLLGY